MAFVCHPTLCKAISPPGLPCLHHCPEKMPPSLGLAALTVMSTVPEGFVTEVRARVVCVCARAGASKVSMYLCSMHV